MPVLGTPVPLLLPGTFCFPHFCRGAAASSVLLLHSSSKAGPGEPRVLSPGCLCDFRGISFPQPLAHGHRVGFTGWQVAGKPSRVKIGRGIAREQGLICAGSDSVKGVAGVRAEHPACGSGCAELLHQRDSVLQNQARSKISHK